MKRKILSAIVTLCIIVSLFSGVAFAADTGKTVVTAPSVQANPGDIVSMDITIANNPGIIGATLGVSYPSELSLTGAVSGDAFSMLVMTKPGSFGSPCNFMWDGQEVAPEQIKDGVILTLIFTLSTDADTGSSYEVQITMSNAVDNDLNPVDVLSENGSITIGTITPVHTHTMTHVAAKAATCEEAGNFEYWICTGCGKYFSDETGEHEITLADTVIPALSHDWGKPSYEWSTDNKTVTAKRVCAHNTSHIESETVDTTSEVTKPAACEDKGETTYTAAFTNPAFEKQTKTVDDIATLGHDWGDWVVTKPATETEKGEETRTCRRCSKTEKRDIPQLTADEETDLSVDGVFVTRENCNDILGDGTAVYDYSTKTLTLTNINISSGGIETTDREFYIYIPNGTSATVKYIRPTCGVHISGTGTLHLTTDFTAIDADSIIEITDTTVNIDGGLYCRSGRIIFDNVKITCTGIGGYGYCIVSDQGSIVIRNNSKVSLTAQGSNILWATGGGIMVEDSEIEIHATAIIREIQWRQAFDGYYAIFAEAGDITVKGNSKVHIVTNPSEDGKNYVGLMGATVGNVTIDSSLSITDGRGNECIVGAGSDQQQFPFTVGIVYPDGTEPTEILIQPKEGTIEPETPVGPQPYFPVYPVNPSPSKPSPTTPEKPDNPTEPVDPDPSDPTPIIISFNDIRDGDFFYDAVLWAVENSVTAGTTDVTFSPYAPCSRAQVVTFLWRTCGSPEPTDTVNPFADVNESDYFYKAVLWAVENGITAGTSETTFSPSEPCTRAQVVTLLWRACGSPEPETGNNPFADVTENDYFYKAVLWAVENGVTAGTSTTTFSPSESCSRAQIVTFLYRVMGKED